MKQFPVIEIFGPVIQGEGVMAGQQTHFLRMGGCDFRCSWCDTMYAVLPEEVKKNSTKMTATEIALALGELAVASKVFTVTISGGNPAMHDLSQLVGFLKEAGFTIVVETQGTLHPEWLWDCQLVTVSPKPPSSGMVQPKESLDPFMKAAVNGFPNLCIKTVVKDIVDFKYAKEVHLYTKQFPRIPGHITNYMQPMTDQTFDNIGDMRKNLLGRTEWITREVIADPDLNFVRIMPQVHSLVYGYARGV